MEKYSKEGKLLHALRCKTIRELVNKSNSLNIAREDVVTVIKESEYYVLLYYYQGV